MKRLMFLSVLLLIFSTTIRAQVQSTAMGGLWNDPGTWIGGAVPNAASDVVIMGPVVHGSANGYDIITEYCHNLTIMPTGSLQNADYGGGTGIFPLIVSGNVINNGVVSDGPTDLLKIVISGDLTNNNVWMPYRTEFQTLSNHNLSLAPGKSFGSIIVNNMNSSFTALTDMLFTCDYTIDGNIQRDNFYLNGNIFNVGDHKIELRQCMINKGTLTGNFEILGTFKLNIDVIDTLVFIGNITVTDTLQANVYNMGYGIQVLKIIGNITNNGVIRDNEDTFDKSILNPDDLNILITGNITNNGKWTCNYVNLIGTETQYLSQSPGKRFDSYFYDLNAVSKVQALSDITITNNFSLNGATFEMGRHTLTIDGWLKNGTINNTTLHNGFLQGITSLSHLVLEGTVTIDDNNIFKDTVIIAGTIRSNDYGSGSYIYNLLVDGDITNNGTIKNMNDGDVLSLEITGDITNNGIWQHSFTKFKGTHAQHISSLDGHILNGDFSDSDSTSSIIANSDLSFSGNWNLGKAVLDMQNHHITFQPEKWVRNGYIKNASVKNGYFNNAKFLNEATFLGKVTIADFVSARSNVIIQDTLLPFPNGGGTYTYPIVIFGNVINNGAVINNESDLLTVSVAGDITNYGKWNVAHNNILFYTNGNTHKLKYYNTGSSNITVNGCTINGIGANAFTIISGGGNAVIGPNEYYEVDISFNSTMADTIAQLNIGCPQMNSFSTFGLIGHKFDTIEDVKEITDKTLLDKFSIDQNYPNPFNPSTTINYQLPAAEKVTLKIYDILGNEVALLVNEEKPAGNYQSVFNGSKLSSGIYFYQLKAGNFLKTKKMLLLK